jgi:hypothetical protein
MSLRKLKLKGPSKIQFDDASQNILVLILFIQLLLNNGIYLFMGSLILGLVLINLQKPFKPAIFTLIFLYHFLQISAGVWLSNYLGEDINYRSPSTGVATVLSYFGLVFLMLPIIYYNNKLPDFTLQDLRKYAFKLDVKKILIVYLVVFFMVNIISSIAFRYAGFTQIIVSFVKVKWFLFYLLGIVCILQKKMLKAFILCFLLEFLSGFFSYFSEFKDVLFFTVCLLITFLYKVNSRQVLLAIVGLVFLFYLGVFWTTIKGEYRTYLNQGSKTQTVQVSEEEALNKLIELIQTGKESYEEDAMANFLDRIQYTYHFAKTIDNVPALLPYEYGSNWGYSIMYALTPRALNPDKPIFEATVKTRKYTGLAYAGLKQGASFSLGYFPDSYIDFGTVGMFIPLFLLGALYGSTYFFFLRKSSPNILFNYAVVTAIFMEFIIFEADNTKIVGRLFATLLTFYMLKIFAFPWLYRYLSAAPQKEKQTVKNA